jgi:hypothetical protein
MSRQPLAKLSKSIQWLSRVLTLSIQLARRLASLLKWREVQVSGKSCLTRRNYFPLNQCHLRIQTLIHRRIRFIFFDNQQSQ